MSVPMQTPTHIILSGSVATGKSTILKRIITYFQSKKVCQIYPEFIHEDGIALEILKRRFQGTVSALTLQNFILDKWENMKKLELKEINIYERLPDDAVEVFARMALNDNEYLTQEERLKKLGFPSYVDMNKDNCIWIRYDNDFSKDTNILMKKIESLIGKYQFIVVEVRSETSYQNFKLRNREGENYTPEQLENLYEFYSNYTDEKVKQINCELIEM